MNPVEKQFPRGIEGCRVRNVEVHGPAGRLEAVLNEGSAQAPFAALVAHPHPLGGGSMHNKVVYHAMKALNDPAYGIAAPVLRFNFRGMGLSAGTHHGEAEKDDVLAALAWLKEEYRLPIVAAGFSFGAAMMLAACTGPEAFPVTALLALGLPLAAEGRSYQYPHLSLSSLPKLFLSGDSDSFALAEELSKIVATAHPPTKLVLLPGADHFFTNRTDEMKDVIAGWLKELKS